MIKILMKNRLSPWYGWRFADCPSRATRSRLAVSKGQVPQSPGARAVSPPGHPCSHSHPRWSWGTSPSRPLTCALLQNLQPKGCFGSFRAHTTPGINQSHFTCIFSRDLTIYFHPDFPYLLQTGRRGEAHTAGIPLPSPHCLVGSISPLFESPLISSS